MNLYLPKLLFTLFTFSFCHAQYSDAPKEKDTIKSKTPIQLDEVWIQKNPFIIQPIVTRSTIKIMDLPQKNKPVGHRSTIPHNIQDTTFLIV